MSTISYAASIREALTEEMRRDAAVVLMGEDIGVYGGAFGVTAGLLDEFGPNRVIETPISENSIVGVAAGAAMTGLRPVVEIMFMDFLALAMDQLANHAAKLHYIYGGQVSVPIVIRTPAGGGRGYGASHSQSLEAWCMSVAGLKVVAPSTPGDAKRLLKSAIRDDSPVLFVEHKLLYAKEEDMIEEAVDDTMPLGRASVRREGTDVTVIAHSKMVDHAVDAADELADRELAVEIIDLRSLNPLDLATIIESVQKTGRAVVVEEGNRRGGVGAEVTALIVEHCLPYLDGKVLRVGAADTPIPSSTFLEAQVLPCADDIVDACLASMSWE